MARKSNVSVHGEGWYGAAQAARITGHSLAMVNYLCRTEIVEPSCTCKRGHGSTRHYSFGDLVALRLVAHLSKSGVRPLRLRAAMQMLRKVQPSITLTTLPARHLITDGKDIYLRREGETVERLDDGQLAFAFVVELSQLQAEVAGALTKAA